MFDLYTEAGIAAAVDRIREQPETATVTEEQRTYSEVSYRVVRHDDIPYTVVFRLEHEIDVVS